MQTLLSFMLAMSITLVLIPLLMRWAVPLHIIDMPDDDRKLHRAPVPRVGGIAMVAGVLLALLLLGLPTRAMQALWACIATLLVFGVWDDRNTLRARAKFAGQAVAALIAMLWGNASISSVTLIERMPLPQWIALPVTFLFLVGGTNAFNLSDGLDGLAGGMAMLCLCGTALLAYTVGSVAIGSAALVMVGAVLGFLRFNTHPARVFMGDGGSQVLGFSAAYLALRLTQNPDIPLSTALPLLLLGVPIIDTLMVMTERLLAGRSPFIADRRHIHYRLLALGFEHWEAVSILYLLQASLFVAAWFMRYDSDLVVGATFVAFAVLVVTPIRIAQHLGLRIRRTPSGADLGPRPPPDPLSSPDTVAPTRVDLAGGAAVDTWRPRFPVRAIGSFLLGATLAAYAAWVLVTGRPPSRDMQLLALSLAVLLGAGLLLRWRRPDAAWTDKVALYCCAALAVFLAHHGLPAASVLHELRVSVPQVVEYGLCALLGLGMLVCIRGSGERPFRLTSLDILVLLVVATVPNLPDSVASAKSLGLTVAELVLLFYSLEALSIAAGRRWRWLSAAAVIFLVGLALRTSL